MASDLDHTAYASCLHEVFSARMPDGSIELELDEVEEHARARERGETRAPFTLIFLGPKDSLLPEGSHALAHADLKVQYTPKLCK